VVELSPDAILLADHQGQIQLVNRQTEVLFGYARADLLGQPVELLLPTRFQGIHPEHRAAYVADPHTRPMGTGLALFARRQDGSEFPVEISLSPLTQGPHPLVMSTIRDVTAQRQLERERAEQAERLRLQAELIEAAHDAIVVRDPTDHLLSSTLAV
jgi:PAS domain S-box-containing protein